MKNARRTASYLLFFVLSIGTCDVIAQEWGQDRSIEQVSPSVYRWGSDGQYGAYVLTSDGIIVVDGHFCDSGTLQWLKSELQERHGVPVKYVVLSHDHPDHICNSQIFSATAVTIGHRNIRPHILREGRKSAVPDVTFEESMDIHLGGLKVTLLYFGPSHSDNLIQVHIPGEKVLIAIDIAKGKSIYPDYRDMDVHSELKVLKILANLEDVDVVLPGHGSVKTQQNFRDSHRFLQALRNEVLQLMIDGKTLDAIRDQITMVEFSDYRGISQYLDANIVTMYDYLYRYREPNNRITADEAVICQEDYRKCRTSN